MVDLSVALDMMVIRLVRVRSGGELGRSRRAVWNTGIGPAPMASSAPAHVGRCGTWDEIQIRLLDLCRKASVATNVSADDRAHAAARVAKIEAGIKAQAKLRREPGYERHIAYVASGRPDYGPAVCGWDGAANGMVEYDDLDRPGVMERRAAILARPDVHALIAEGEPYHG